MNAADTITIAIVDDHTLFRDGLANLLSEFSHIRVLFKAHNGEDLQKQLALHPLPDVTLLDVNMPGMDGFATLSWLTEHHPAARVLALSMFEDDMSIIRMLRKGAGGYVMKECKAAELVTAIEAVHRQGHYINELVTGKLMRALRETDKPDSKTNPLALLSDRELEFINWCCTELTYKEIAVEMNASPRTIDGYREDVFEKLGLKSRTGLVIFAVKNRIYKG